MPKRTFTVYGRPVPQGSMVASYNRKDRVSRVHHVQGAALAQWRAAIRQGAIDADCEVLAGPVAIAMVFGLPRPTYHYRRRHYRTTMEVKEEFIHARPIGHPDVDKLARAVLDALWRVCYHDDAQVVVLVASKIYDHGSYFEVGEYGGKWALDAAKLEEEAITGTEEGQLPLSDLRETWR